MRIMTSIGALALLFASAAAEAVVYEFTAALGSFTLTLPGVVTTRTNFTPAQLDSCTAVPFCSGVGFFPVTLGSLTSEGEYDAIRFSVPALDQYYYFDDGAFAYNGVYLGLLTQPATLRVTGAQDRPVPEPASWAMMIVGFGLAGAALRVRARAPAPA